MQTLEELFHPWLFDQLIFHNYIYSFSLNSYSPPVTG
ncbi:hypothetical protein EMIT0357P_180037 [Pseudomonas marginalis]